MTTPTRNRKLESARSYLDALFENTARLQVIRLDLGYTKEASQDVTLETFKRDVKHMMNNARYKPSLFADKVGYTVRFEEGKQRGLHGHMVVYMDGHQCKNGAYYADQMGQYWAGPITQGRGTYHNCNRNEGRYANCGIGMIDHTDTEKRQHLTEQVLPYLTKADQAITKPDGAKRQRTFIRGLMPKPKSKAGRPRNACE